ncbi:MAG: alginate export family protein [Gammaproteobacteria bacterium]
MLEGRKDFDREFVATPCILGSGDPTPKAGSDRSFRQTGLQANEAGFGGVHRYTHYGILLAPELSNLGILTLGGGVSLLRSSSLDLVYHHYRLVEPATSLRDTRLELTLTGEDRDLGNEIDIVLALEEWERFELEFSAAAFRSGRAFGEEHGTWSYGGFFALRIAF